MDKERYIWIKGEKIPVSEEVYLEYYRPVWAAKKRQERGKRCRTSDGSRCMDDCQFCGREPDGGVLSLDKFIEDGYEAADEAETDELAMEKILLDELYAALAELTDDERYLIDALYFKERSERDIATQIGRSKTGVHKQKERILEKLKNFFIK